MSPRLLIAAGVSSAVAVLAAYAMAQPRAQQPAMATALRPASDFAGISNQRARSQALFGEIGKVLQHPRCLNCHPAGESPTQTDAMRLHSPLVVRGPDGMGASGMRCTACHHEENFDPARVPGNPKWMLAPIEMAWQGKTLGQICAQLKDRRRNGDKDMAAMQEHMAHDELVAWGWAPGADRTPAPGTQEQFGALFAAWVQSGAHCPR